MYVRKIMFKKKKVVRKKRRRWIPYLIISTKYYLKFNNRIMIK